MAEFLPISKSDMKRRGWAQCDFVYIIGDAYVDHPSFGHAIISRVLEDAGYKVGIISQPDWKDPASVSALGRPRLGFLVMGGNMDSMVNHYAVSKRHRQTDAYTPGGVMGKRPDYAVTVYCNLIRQTYRDVPVIIGGIEASLRRLAHYDYWSDKLKRSVLLDSQADLLIYGMGERAIVEVANALNDGMDIRDVTLHRRDGLSHARGPGRSACDHTAVLSRDAGGQIGLCQELLPAISEYRPILGQAAHRAVQRPRIRRTESAAEAALAGRDGSHLRSALHADVSPEL